MRKSSKKKQPLRKNLTISIDALLEQANLALSKLQPELALQFYKRAMEMQPENTNLMDAAADVYIQIGDFAFAFDLLSKSTQLQPETNICKWFYLAQLQQGIDSLASYQTGIRLAKQCLSRPSEDELTTQSMIKQLSKACCSVAELYLTDLCFEENAEMNCEASITEALSFNSSSLDAQQTLASLRLSQNRTEEAAGIMEGVFAQVQAIRERIRSRTVLEELSGAPEEDSLDTPDLEFCQSTAKLLVECGAVRPALCELAIDLVDSLLEDDDENVELWYILGIAEMGSSPPDLTAARAALERAREMLSQLRDQMVTEFPYSEEERLVLEHLQILEQMETETANGETTTQSQLTHLRKFGKKEEKKEMEIDEEWSTCEEDEEENEEESEQEN